jgi:hypothetical protein
MWTRLIYLNLNTAFKVQREGKRHLSPALRAKYRRYLTNEFRKVDLPIFFNPPKTNENNQYQKKPKAKKYDLNARRDREDRIRQAILKADDELLKHRQNFLNNRRYRGVDRMMQEVFPDWMDIVRTRVAEE